MTTSAPGIRERLLSAAAQLTCDVGWSAVTMGKVAASAGVSRQTVYNELGSKHGMAHSMVMRELARFLGAVEAELDGHDDVVTAIRAAAEQTFVMARRNPLLEAVLASAHGAGGAESGGSSDLLPYLTTEAEPLIDAAREVILERVRDAEDVGVGGAELELAADTVVRLVLSHVMQPHAEVEASAGKVAWVAEHVLEVD